MTRSNEDWTNIIAAGVPITGPETTAATVNFSEIAPLILSLIDNQTEQKVLDAIRGWLIAVRDHYPSIFIQHFQDPRVRKLLAAPISGRDIKLRRIALSNLGKIA